MKVKSRGIKRMRNGKSRNSCPGCKCNLSHGGFHIIYKDVVECKGCGFIWVEMLDSNLLRIILRLNANQVPLNFH